MNLQLLTAVMAALTLSSCAGIRSNAATPSAALYILRLRVQLLTKRLNQACPHLLSTEPFLSENTKERREALSDIDRAMYEHSLAVERGVFNQILSLLKQCYEETANTTTPAPTTTAIPLPPQCTSPSTLNLTESWRKDYPGTSLRNDDGPMLNGGKAWFRITGEAGNLLRNTCPGTYECGSNGPYWSGADMPTTTGETISFTMYEGCGTSNPRPSRVTRCSSDRGGLVYRVDSSNMGGPDTICGMD